MKTHEVKILSNYFDKVLDGSKTFEIRKNDRDYEEGDEIILKEVEKDFESTVPNAMKFTGRKVKAEIGYVFYGGLVDYGININTCVFSLLNVEEIK